MRRSEIVAAIRSGRRVRLFYGAGPREATHARGEVIGYCDAPQILVRLDSGETLWWRADLSETETQAGD